MEAHGAIRDCQAQSDAAGLAAAGIVDAVERAEKFVERVLGYAGAGVGHAHHRFRFARAIIPALRVMQSVLAAYVYNSGFSSGKFTSCSRRTSTLVPSSV